MIASPTTSGSELTWNKSPARRTPWLRAAAGRSLHKGREHKCRGGLIKSPQCLDGHKSQKPHGAFHAALDHGLAQGGTVRYFIADDDEAQISILLQFAPHFAAQYGESLHQARDVLLGISSPYIKKERIMDAVTLQDEPDFGRIRRVRRRRQELDESSGRARYRLRGSGWPEYPGARPRRGGWRWKPQLRDRRATIRGASKSKRKEFW